MHPIIATELARQLVDERIRAARAGREADRNADDATKVVSPQRALVRESLLRLKRREERA